MTYTEFSVMTCALSTYRNFLQHAINDPDEDAAKIDAAIKACDKLSDMALEMYQNSVGTDYV